MKLSQALREVARLHAEEPNRKMFKRGIGAALICLDYWAWEGYYGWFDDQEEDLRLIPGDWTARPWMCLILAEYLQETGR